ncbi:MAG: transcriptional repressor [Desulfovibrio sp.]|uniref:Fur family transcriptional regulator n=1 Tax=Desulfovibrio sp. TaxID=885 RepID=UPI00135E889E|nr:hypothetical protein [Desulfovibrio sp.]MTJ91632.1 transcriptional repressor [Desulfovibrio sp.]
MQQKKLNQTDRPAPPSAADVLSACQGLRLTRVRRMVLEFLLGAQMPVKAYDILDALRHGAPKALTPASIYRALDYLLQEGLVHKVGTLNAYVACAEACPETCADTNAACTESCAENCTCSRAGSHRVRHAPVFMLVCPGCRKSKEICDPALYQTIFSAMQRQGFQLQGDTVELTGICPGCAQQQDQSCTI